MPQANCSRLENGAIAGPGPSTILGGRSRCVELVSDSLARVNTVGDLGVRYLVSSHRAR